MKDTNHHDVIGNSTKIEIQSESDNILSLQLLLHVQQLEIDRLLN